MTQQNVTRLQNTIFAAIEGAHGNAASLNDVLAALASAEARYLAAIPSRKHRRAVEKAMADVRTQMTAHYIDIGGGPKVKTIVTHGGVQ